VVTDAASGWQVVARPAARVNHDDNRQGRGAASDLVRNELATTADKKSADVIPREVVVQYVVGAFMAVMTWWLDSGAKLPPQRIDAMFRRLATEGIMRSYS
jgi:hypothetical protein